MASEWFYFKNAQQQGPVSSTQLKELAAAGELLEADLIWKEGMTEWIAAASVKGLFAGSGDASAPASAEKIEYYNPTGAWGSRAAVTLRGFPPPMGKADHWPLSEQDLLVLTKAESFRKPIRTLTALFRVLFVLGIIGCAGMMLLLVQGGMAGAKVTPIGAVLFFLTVAQTVLLFFSFRANHLCSLWPAIVWMILYSLSLLVNLGNAIYAIASGHNLGVDAGISLAVVLLDMIFIYLCIAAYTAIPRFLKCPVWAQEALVHAKL